MTERQKRLRAAVNSLSLVGVRWAMRSLLAPCALCGNAIRAGEDYKRKGTLQAHETCFAAVARDLKEKGI